MLEGHYIFRKQVGHRGFYGEIKIQVEEIPSRSNDLIGLSCKEYEDWEVPLNFGLMLFSEHYNKKSDKLIKTNILTWNWLPGNTDASVASYTIFMALSKALGCDYSKSYFFDETTKSFIYKYN